MNKLFTKIKKEKPLPIILEKVPLNVSIFNYIYCTIYPNFCTHLF